ncbi:rna annealing factor [Moniliophthora roreri]|nr:rna annealing factor [Moniliophthora roreri]
MGATEFENFEVSILLKDLFPTPYHCHASVPFVVTPISTPPTRFTTAPIRSKNAMDQSLDEIIKSKPKGIRRASGRSARSQVLGTSAARAAASPGGRAAKAAAKANVAAKQVTATQQAQPADKIIVSNLPPDVNEQQVKELFHTTVGPLREVSLTYDSNGRSKGVASVHFQRKGDGTKAYQQYNNRLIDGS